MQKRMGIHLESAARIKKIRPPHHDRRFIDDDLPETWSTFDNNLTEKPPAVIGRPVANRWMQMVHPRMGARESLCW